MYLFMYLLLGNTAFLFEDFFLYNNIPFVLPGGAILKKRVRWAWLGVQRPNLRVTEPKKTVANWARARSAAKIFIKYSCITLYFRGNLVPHLCMRSLPNYLMKYHPEFSLSVRGLSHLFPMCLFSPFSLTKSPDA